MSSFYIVPTTDKSLGSVKSSVLAAGISLLFMYLVLMLTKVDPLRIPDSGNICVIVGRQVT